MAGISLSAANSVTNLSEIANTKKATPFEAQQSFTSALKDAINSVNESQIQSDEVTKKMANGEDVDLHTVMITSQKASISLSATLEIRNKVVEAYQEIMRMNM